MGSSPFLPGTHRALVVLRFLLNTTKETHCFLPNPITLYYLTNYIRSAETGEIFGLASGDPVFQRYHTRSKRFIQLPPNSLVISSAL